MTMQNDPWPKTRDLVLIGGGHSHALVLRKWGMAPLPGVRVTLINPGPTAPYTGMLPGFVAGHYSRDELEIDLVRLARFAGARLVFGRATGIDLEARRITLDSQPDIAFDVASFDVGITSEMAELPGFARHGLAAKPLGRFAAGWQATLAGATPGKTLSIVVLGGGVAGVELSLTMGFACRRRGVEPKITIIERDRLLSGVTPATRDALIAHLKTAEIDIKEGVQATKITKSSAVLSDKTTLTQDLVVGAAGATPHAWVAEMGLPVENGFLRVDDRLQVQGRDDVFAVGDCAHMAASPRPKAGVFAVRQAPVLFHNLRAALAGTPRRRFHPQSTYLKLITLGPESALGEKFSRPFQGAWVWRLKDRIDRRFMAQFDHLKPMPRPVAPATSAKGLRDLVDGRPPLCSGCGAKVGPGALAEALGAEFGDDAAQLASGDQMQVLSVDHLSAITPDPWRFARIAAHHALGDVFAMGAHPQAMLVSLTLPRLAPRLQAETLREVMAGLREVADEGGAQIIGGHTTEADDMSIGLTVTGLAMAPIGLDGAQPGDALILTKPIGSGTILAGEMALQAKGTWVQAALDAMDQSQAMAATILAPVAHAMTDVTGFGLAGHLSNILKASRVGARVDLEAVPLMDGAVELAALGVRSSLWDANRAAVGWEMPDTPQAALLFDPQTSGGLLAAVPAGKARSATSELKKSGYSAAIIGEILKSDQDVRIV